MFPGSYSCRPATFKDHFNRKSTSNDFMISEEFNRKKRYFARSFYIRNVFSKTFYKVLIYRIIIVLIIKYFKYSFPKVCRVFNIEYPLLQVLQSHYYLPGKVNEPSG